MAKRDNAYYEDLLRRNHPTVYADLQAGKFNNLSEARRAAGTLKKRTPLQELQNAWRKATPTEQHQFLARIGVSIPAPALSTPPTPPAAHRPIAKDRQLEPWAIYRINDILKSRGIKPGVMMREMGFNSLNASVGRALSRPTKLQPAVLTALEKWLTANAHI